MLHRADFHDGHYLTAIGIYWRIIDNINRLSFVTSPNHPSFRITRWLMRRQSIEIWTNTLVEYMSDQLMEKKVETALFSYETICIAKQNIDG